MIVPGTGLATRAGFVRTVNRKTLLPPPLTTVIFGLVRTWSAYAVPLPVPMIDFGGQSLTLPRSITDWAHLAYLEPL